MEQTAAQVKLDQQWRPCIINFSKNLKGIPSMVDSFLSSSYPPFSKHPFNDSKSIFPPLSDSLDKGSLFGGSKWMSFQRTKQEFQMITGALLCLFQLGHQCHDPTSQYLNLPSFFAVKWTWTRLFSDLHVKLRQFAKIISIRCWHPSSEINDEW